MPLSYGSNIPDDSESTAGSRLRCVTAPGMLVGARPAYPLDFGISCGAIVDVLVAIAPPKFGALNRQNFSTFHQSQSID
jgi:hypothetical protein